MQVTIRTIDDVLPHMRDDSGIIVSERPDHTVIDYVYTTDETFDSDMALQCRGLKFDAAGRIIARPFHKFFNLGEREDPFRIDWARGHHIVEKLDGTMIHAVMLDGDLLFMTRMGHMQQAKDAMAIASDGLLALCASQLKLGRTPLFEYTSPENRIVLSYDAPALTLLGIREMVSGRYVSDAEIRALCQHYRVPVAAHHGQIDDIKAFMADTKALEGIEGFVIAFDDGHRIKIKADAYVLRHKALSGAQLEKNVLEWVLADVVDDVVPMLPSDMADRVAVYQRDVQAAISRRAAQVDAFVAAHRGLERREIARAAQESLDKALRPAVFSVLDGKDVRDSVKKHLKWAAHSQTRIDSVRDLYGLCWTRDGLPDIDLG